MTKGIIDWETLLDNFAQDRFAVSLMVDAYVASVDKYLEAIEAAIAAKDNKAIAMTAHSLKGVTMNFGAAEAVRLAQTLELVGYGEDKSDPALLFAELKNQIKMVLAAIAAEPHYYREAG